MNVLSIKSHFYDVYALIEIYIGMNGTTQLQYVFTSPQIKSHTIIIFLSHQMIIKPWDALGCRDGDV